MSQRHSARSLRRSNCSKYLLPAISAVSAGLWAGHWASAVNYTWQVNNSGNASGSWSVMANWTPVRANAATTSADFANFSTLNITADSVITLDQAQAINGIIIGDTDTSTAAGWTINATSSAANDATNILTLESATVGNYELVTVNALGPGKAVTINATLSNNNATGNSLAKAGAGTLVLTANNSSLTGTTAINQGVLVLDFSQSWSPAANILGDTSTGSSAASHLQLQGATLMLKGGAGKTNSQTFSGGTALELGAGKVVLNQNGATSLSINLGALTRNIGSSMDITLPTTGTVSVAAGTGSTTYPSGTIGTPGTDGLLVDTNNSAFVTVNSMADWAAVQTGRIVPASSVGGFYTASTATTLAGNANVVTDVTLTAAATPTSVRFNDAAAHTVNLGAAALATGGILVTPSSGTVTISNGTLQSTSVAAGGDLIIHHAGANPLNISATIADAGTGTTVLTKNGPGTVILTGNNTYSGNTVVNEGTIVVAGGSTGTMTPAGLPDVNWEIAPAYGNNATVVVNNGTLNADRTIIAGNSGNFAGGDGHLIQTGGVINSSLWFTVGSFGNGTFDMTGGVLNQNQTGVTQMEVAVFGSGRSTMNVSGTAAVNLYSNGNLAIGVVNNTGAGTLNLSANAQITFYSDAGITAGGNGNLNVGPGGSGQYFANLNGGTLTVGAIAGNSARGNLTLNGTYIKATRANANIIGGFNPTNGAKVGLGGAIIDTGTLTVGLPQALSHSSALGSTPDGGLTKNGAGTLRLSGASTYTGATVINAGTVQLVNTAGVPAAVGNYSFDNIRDSNNVLVTSGTLADNYTVVNAGSGGTLMSGKVNNSDNVLGAGSPGGSVVAGKFGNGLSLDGTGSSVDIASQIVDQSSGRGLHDEPLGQDQHRRRPVRRQEHRHIKLGGGSLRVLPRQSGRQPRDPGHAADGRPSLWWFRAGQHARRGRRVAHAYLRGHRRGQADLRGWRARQLERSRLQRR